MVPDIYFLVKVDLTGDLSMCMQACVYEDMELTWKRHEVITVSVSPE